jgi:hypothetical protein
LEVEEEVAQCPEKGGDLEGWGVHLGYVCRDVGRGMSVEPMLVVVVVVLVLRVVVGLTVVGRRYMG